MALVTIQRSPSPSNSTDSLSEDSQDGVADESELSGSHSSTKSKRSKAALKKLRKLFTTIRFVNKLRFSENYFAVKGAALILPRSECTSRRRPSHPNTAATGVGGGDIHRHLRMMIHLLRPQDTIKVAVKLESLYATRNRYLTVVSSTGRQDNEESLILGLDVGEDKATIGLIIPIWGNTKIKLDGDGGFLLTTSTRDYIFKPVSVQAMWSCLNSLNKLRAVASENNYYPMGLTHTWVSYYQTHITSDQSCINEWNTMEDVESRLYNPQVDGPQQVEENIKLKLKEIMTQVDLDNVTCKYLRNRLEEELNVKLDHMKQVIEEEMFVILRVMDSSSKIFDYLYLGSEWNASNLEELQRIGIKYILNISREIDNFYPELFEYCNVRLYDVASSELLKHWDKTYKFIKKAKHHHSKVLVHCRMGISRSASTVMAFAMKEYGWSVKEAMKYVKDRRNVVWPNSGFMKQLVTYEGILDASKQRHNSLWRSQSENDLTNQQLTLMDSRDPSLDTMNSLNLDFSSHTPNSRDTGPRSWSPADGAADILLKASHFDLGSSDECSEEGSEYANLPMLVAPPGGGEDGPLPIMPPLLFTLEHLDQCDVSSRSADSLDIDEAFQDGIPEEEGAFARLVSFDKGPVVLLNYTQTTDHTPRGVSVTHSEDLSEESDFEDEETSPIRGFYDVAMLTGSEPEGDRFVPVEQEEGEREEGEERVDLLSEELETLHPDMKLELAISDYKKKLRIAKLLMFQQRERGGDPEEGQPEVILPKVKRGRRRTHSKEQVAGAKLRPDDFWIKDIPPSPCPQEPPEPQEPSVLDKQDLILNLEGLCATETSTEDMQNEPNGLQGEATGPTDNGEGSTREIEDSKEAAKFEKDAPKEVVEVKEKPKMQSFISQIEVNIPSICSESVSSIDRTEDESSRGMSEASAGMTDDGEEDSGKDSEGQLSKEVGVWQHYEKEAIPWSAGTVKRTTQEMEEKQKSGSLDRGLRLLSGGSPSGSQEKLTMDSSKHYVSEEEVKSNLQRDEFPSPKSSPRSVKSVSSSMSSGEVDTGAREEDQPASVYEKEDIPFIPASVQRIKQQIEEREKISSFSDPEESGGKIVKRSSSCRSESTSPPKSKFERNSSRRRTVLPIVRSSPARFYRSKSTGGIPQQEVVKDTERDKGQGQKEKEELEVKVIKIKEEAVALKEGQVQKHKKEFEERDSSVQKDPAQKAAACVIGEAGLIRSGSVKKQRQEIETKYGTPDSTDIITSKTEQPEAITTSKVDSCRDNNTKSLSALDRLCDKDKKAEDLSKLSPTLKRSSESKENVDKLSPTLEKVLNKSPSLRRKLQTDEVIACHSPQTQEEVDVPLTGSEQGIVGKVALGKSVSVPLVKREGGEHKASLADSPKSRSRLRLSVGEEEPAPGVERYEEEGIDWCVGTVRQQLQAMEGRDRSNTDPGGWERGNTDPGGPQSDTPEARESKEGETRKQEPRDCLQKAVSKENTRKAETVDSKERTQKRDNRENTRKSSSKESLQKMEPNDVVSKQDSKSYQQRTTELVNKTEGVSVEEEDTVRTGGASSVAATEVPVEGHTVSTQCGGEEVGIVQKICTELEEGQKSRDLKHRRLHQVESSSHERKHSLGSKTEIQPAGGEQQGEKVTKVRTGLGRSASLKEHSPTTKATTTSSAPPVFGIKYVDKTKTSNKKIPSDTKSPGKDTKVVTDTVLATHLPKVTTNSPVGSVGSMSISAPHTATPTVEEKEVVIIARTQKSPAQKQKGLPKSDKVRTKSTSDDQQLLVKPICDITAEDTSSSPRESTNRDDPSSPCYQGDDLSVKDLLDKFETGSVGKKSPPGTSEAEGVKCQQEGEETVKEGSVARVDSGKKVDKVTSPLVSGQSGWEASGSRSSGGVTREGEGSLTRVDSGTNVTSPVVSGQSGGWEEVGERRSKKLHGKTHPLSKLTKQSP